MKLEYITCPKCGQVNPELMLCRVMFEVQLHKIKDKEKRKQLINRLRSLSWEEFAKFLEVKAK